MKKVVKHDPSTGMWHTLKIAFLFLLRNPFLNLGINVLMLLMNGIACVAQFLTGNYILGNILLISTFSCVSAVLYWIFITWDRFYHIKKSS